jgi:hypothetical protein
MLVANTPLGGNLAVQEGRRNGGWPQLPAVACPNASPSEADYVILIDCEVSTVCAGHRQNVWRNLETKIKSQRGVGAL